MKSLEAHGPRPLSARFLGLLGSGDHARKEGKTHETQLLKYKLQRFSTGHRLNEGRLFLLWLCFCFRPCKGKWRWMCFAFLENGETLSICLSLQMCPICCCFMGLWLTGLTWKVVEGGPRKSFMQFLILSRSLWTLSPCTVFYSWHKELSLALKLQEEH